MSAIKLNTIKSALKTEGWTVVSDEYVNLDTIMVFQCPEGHLVSTSWKKLRNKCECPTCKKQKETKTNGKIVSKAHGVQRTLAIDQATHITGYAIFDNENLIQYGTFTTNLEDEISRCSAIKEWLLSMIRNWNPDYIGLEGIQLQDESSGQKMGVTVFQTLARLQGILMETCYSQKVQYEICPTNTWRHACNVRGRTRADKKRSMQTKVKDWYKVNITDDEADAIGIGHYLTKQITKNTTIQNWET